jgi:hypothetical protein
LSTGWSKQDFKLNADPLNQPIWNGDNNDPDVCCQAPDGKEEPISYIVYGVSSQGAAKHARAFCSFQFSRVSGPSLSWHIIVFEIEKGK